jgi:5-formyltetrahydrofolate cyclo-ligase
MRMVRGALGDRLLRSVALWAALAELEEYAAASTVLAYAGFGDEPDTDPLHARVGADGKTLLLPRVEGDELVAVAVAPGVPFQRSSWGVLEPLGPAVDVAAIDLVIVPGLAFTMVGDRLGYGRGVYDRFLATLPDRTVTVGACFVELIVDALPVEPHDRRMHRIVTDGTVTDGIVTDQPSS